MRIDWLSVIAGACLLAAAGLLGVACREAVYPTAEEVYTAELRACVDAATTIQAADACQHRVTAAHFPNSDGGLLNHD
jgi:hypothetical protein